MAAGPDGFHQPSPIPQTEQQAFWMVQEPSTPSAVMKMGSESIKKLIALIHQRSCL
jgi:hypothetical protein